MSLDLKGRNDEKMQNLLKQLELLKEPELIGESFLTAREEICDLSRRRNVNREALRALRSLVRKKEQILSYNTEKEKIPEVAVKARPGRFTGAIKTHCARSGSLLYQLPTTSSTWMCVGDMFISMPTNTLLSEIEREQHQLDERIDDLWKGLRPKIDRLREMEGEEPTRGSGLKPLSKEEVAGLKQAFGPGYC